MMDRDGDKINIRRRFGQNNSEKAPIARPTESVIILYYYIIYGISPVIDTAVNVLDD